MVWNTSSKPTEWKNKVNETFKAVMQDRHFNSKISNSPIWWAASSHIASVSPCVSHLFMLYQKYRPPAYLFVLEDPTAVHSAPPVGTLSITKAKSCLMSQLTSYKTVGPQNSRYVGFHLHLNSGLDSSTSTQFVMQVGAQEWRSPMVTLFILIYTMYLPFRKCLLYTCKWFIDLFANSQTMRSKESFWTFLKVQ